MLAKHIVRQFFTQIIGLITGFITSIITTRILGVEGRGDFALILNTANFFAILLGLSFSSAVVHYVSTEKGPLRDMINTMSMIILALILTYVLVLVFFPFSKFDFLIPSNEHAFFNKSVLLILFVTTLTSSLFNAVLSGKQQFQKQQKAYFFIAPLSLLAYVVLFYTKQQEIIDFRSFIIFYLLINAVPTLVAYLIYVKNTRPSFTFTFMSTIQFKYILNFSFLAYLANLLQFLTYRMDFWFVNYYCGNTQLGIYSLSVNLAQMLWLLPQAVSTIFIAYSGQRDQSLAIAQTNLLSRTSVNIIFCATIFLELTIGYIIPLLYGVEFSDAVPLFQLLLIGIVPFSITTIIASYFAGKGNIRINLYCSLIGFIVCLVSDFILIPTYGNTGAAIATVLSYLISTLFIIIVYMQHTNSSIQDILFMKKEDFLVIKNKIGSKFLFLEKK